MKTVYSHFWKPIALMMLNQIAAKISGKTLRPFMVGIILPILSLTAAISTAHAKTQSILNVSYDPTREFFHAYNQIFQQYWKQKTGQDVLIYESHGGSGKQARAVIDGMQADLVTLALAGDIDAINKYRPLLSKDWANHFPNHSVPYTSTIVFLVRKGNPKHIHDWDDLIKPGIQVITPNPKTSGGARWNFLAAWMYAHTHYQTDKAIYAYLKTLYQHVPILDTGARDSSLTFTQRHVGDVLISWENEAYMAMNENGKGQFEVITPSVSILTEPPVALVDSVIDQRKSRAVATAYLNYLYSDPAQNLIGRHYYRPINPAIARQFTIFKPLKLMRIEDFFKGWKEINQRFFRDHAMFDQIMAELNP